MLVGLFNGVMISVKGNTELILYGGKTSKGVSSEIWRYLSRTQSWTWIGNLQQKRTEFAGMVVPYLECP